MRATLSLLPITAGLFCCILAAQQPSPNSVSKDTGNGAVYISHVTVIDTATGNEAQDRTVVISADRISEVRASKGTKTLAGAKIVDGTGKYLIPGLWDMHVHAVRAERIGTMLPMFVANGVLGIRDMGTDMKLADVEVLRKHITSGLRIAPRIISTGQILDGRLPPPSRTFAVIKTPAEGRAAVQSLKAGGADFVKVYTWLPRDAYLAIAEEAKKQGLPFVGHVPMSVTAVEASAAGQKSIEHLNGIDLVCSARESDIRNTLLKQDGEMGDAVGQNVIIEASASYSDDKGAKVFATLAQNHTWQIPTFVAFLQDAEFNNSRVTDDPRLKYIPPSIRKQWCDYAQHHAGPTPWDKVFERHLAILGAMHRAGVPIMAGTDSAWGVPFTYAGFSLQDELALLVRAGLTPAEVLEAATIDPARFLGTERDLGSVEKGKIADLLLLDADPLQDIHNTTRISGVFLSGRYLDRAALDKLLKEAEAAANSASEVKAYVH
jgi:amidohydrolase family protein